jgi:hypothetical protein
MLGGDHRVDSSLGAGTRVELKVPIDGGYSALAKGIVSRRPIREPPSRCDISTDMLIDFSVWLRGPSARGDQECPNASPFRPVVYGACRADREREIERKP